MERRRVRRLFNRISPLYPCIDRRLLPEYRRVLDTLDLMAEMNVIDLGTGTGALARAFSERGHPVVGVDFAERLLRRARRVAPRADFRVMDLVDLAEMPSASFDVVGLAYVLHGLDPDLCETTLREVARIARRGVLIFDYAVPGPWYVRLIEKIEGPHYPTFIARPMSEHLRPHGLEVSAHGPTSRFGGWWWAARSG